MSTEGAARIVSEIFLSSFMSGLPPENLAWATQRLATRSEDVQLDAGEVLYRAGDIASDMFFVVSGELELGAPSKPTIAFGERAIVGSADIFIARAREQTATATRPTRLLRIAAGDWMDMLEDNFALAQLALQALARGVHELRVELDDSEEPPARAVLLPAGSEIDLVERVFVLLGGTLFCGADVQSLTSLASVAHEVSAAQGQSLSAERSERSMIVVADGAVTATHPALSEPHTYGRGGLVLGAVAASPDDLGYDVRASARTRAFRIAHEAYFDIMEEHSPLARCALKALAVERELLRDERARRRARHGSPVSS